MANAKFIDAATWASLPEIDVTNGEDLFPQLAAGTYRPVLSGVDSAVIPALTAGAIAQATPTVGDTLTVSGSNATGSATFQWQRDTGGGQADISGATSATYDTTGQPEGDYRRGVSDGVQGPVYTAAVTLGAAATVPATMSAPTVTAVSDTEISVDRAAAPSDGGSAILSYDLRWEVDGSGSWTTVTGITDPQSVTGLTAATLYNVQTRAVNAVGAGAWSASGSATTESGASLDVSFIGYTNSGVGTDNNAANFTFTSLSIGAAAATRKVVAIVHTNHEASSTVTGVAIGGVTATQIASKRVSGISVSAWVADVPTGTTVDVAVTVGALWNRLAVGIYRIVDGTIGASNTADNSNTGSIAVNVNTTTGGAVIAAIQTVNSGAITWTGATENYDADIRTTEMASGALQTGLTAETPRSVSAAFTFGGTTVAAALSFGISAA